MILIKIYIKINIYQTQNLKNIYKKIIKFKFNYRRRNLEFIENSTF